MNGNGGEDFRVRVGRAKARDRADPFSQHALVKRAHKRARISVKEATLDAFDQLGGAAFIYRMGTSELVQERICAAMIIAKLIPLEVAGSLDTSLVVKILKANGEEIERPVIEGEPLGQLASADG